MAGLQIIGNIKDKRIILSISESKKRLTKTKLLRTAELCEVNQFHSEFHLLFILSES